LLTKLYVLCIGVMRVVDMYASRTKTSIIIAAKRQPLTLLKVVVIQKLLIKGARLPLQKANRLLINNNRYKYRGNTIINKDIL
jgi:hypothetical protein